MTNLTITKEKVIAAAAKCGTAKEVLQTLFPEVFEEDKSVDVTGILDMMVRTGGEYKSKGYYLDSLNYNWEIKTDSSNILVLIPTRK